MRKRDLILLNLPVHTFLDASSLGNGFGGDEKYVYVAVFPSLSPWDCFFVSLCQRALAVNAGMGQQFFCKGDDAQRERERELATSLSRFNAVRGLAGFSGRS